MLSKAYLTQFQNPGDNSNAGRNQAAFDLPSRTLMPLNLVGMFVDQYGRTKIVDKESPTKSDKRSPVKTRSRGPGNSLANLPNPNPPVSTAVPGSGFRKNNKSRKVFKVNLI